MSARVPSKVIHAPSMSASATSKNRSHFILDPGEEAASVLWMHSKRVLGQSHLVDDLLKPPITPKRGEDRPRQRRRVVGETVFVPVDGAIQPEQRVVLVAESEVRQRNVERRLRAVSLELFQHRHRFSAMTTAS